MADTKEEKEGKNDSPAAAASSVPIPSKPYAVLAKAKSGPPSTAKTPRADLDLYVKRNIPKKPKILSSPSMRLRRRVALYGGSFDPITNAHINVAAEIIHSKKADEVWVIPCGPRPDKPSLKTSALERFIMCHLAVNGTFGPRFPVKVCDVEVRLPVALATLPLINMLEKKHPEYDFCFVLGEDLLGSLRTWEGPNDPKMGERLYREKEFLLINRPGYDVDDETLPANIERVLPRINGATLVETRLSSSEVRKRIKGGRSLVLQRALTPRRMRSAPTPTPLTKANSTEQDVAAAMIRHAISENRAIDWYGEIEGLVPLAVLSYIKRYNLYSAY